MRVIYDLPKVPLEGCYEKVLKYQKQDQKAVKNHKTLYYLILGSDNLYTF